MMQRLLALFAGIITAMVVMMTVEQITARMYPVPEGFDKTNLEQIKAFKASLPEGAFLMVLLAHGLGTLLGALGASYLAKQEIPRMCGTITAAMLMLAIMSMMAQPHPTWFAPADVLVILAMCPLAIKLARKLGLSRSPDA